MRLSPDAQLDPIAVHKYLTFSFVPGEDVPIQGVKRLLPGRVARRENGRLETQAYFALKEHIDAGLEDQTTAVRLIRKHCKEAVSRRLIGENEVGLYLSGGLDSSGVALWLKQAGVKVHAFSLDFGERSVEKPQAQLVAERLGIPLTLVKVGG